jgi:hypothetical protein
MNRDVELIKKHLLKLPEVRSVEVKENPLPGIDAYLLINVKGRRGFELSQKLAGAISDAKIELWDKKKDFPAVEWEYRFTD